MNAPRSCSARPSSTSTAKRRSIPFTSFFSTLAPATSFNPPGKNSTKPVESLPRDSPRFSPRRTHSPFRPHHLRRIHARMPLPPRIWLLQPARIFAFRRLLHQSRRSSYLRPLARAPIRRNVGTARSPRRILVGGSCRGCWPPGESYSRIRRIATAGFLQRAALRRRRAFSRPLRSTRLAPRALCQGKEVPALYRHSQRSSRRLRLLERTSRRSSRPPCRATRRPATRNLCHQRWRRLFRNCPTAFHLCHHRLFHGAGRPCRFVRHLSRPGRETRPPGVHGEPPHDHFPRIPARRSFSRSVRLDQ